MEVMAEEPLFWAVKLIFPAPETDRPVAMLSFVQKGRTGTSGEIHGYGFRRTNRQVDGLSQCREWFDGERYRCSGGAHAVGGDSACFCVECVDAGCRYASGCETGVSADTVFRRAELHTSRQFHLYQQLLKGPEQCACAYNCIHRIGRRLHSRAVAIGRIY
jgi:hypothetical protein